MATTPLSIDLGNLASGAHTVTVEWVSGGAFTITGASTEQGVAMPHTLRFVAGGAPVLLVVSPGADAPRVTAAALAGQVGRTASRTVPAATVTVQAAQVTLAAAPAGHRLRFSVPGGQAFAMMVAGADAPGASAGSQAGAVTISAAVATVLPAPSATALTSAGAIRRSGTLGAPSAQAAAQAAIVSVLLGAGAPAATAQALAATLGASATTDLPGALASILAGEVAAILAVEVPWASAAGEAGDITISVTLLPPTRSIRRNAQVPRPRGRRRPPPRSR